MSLGAVAQHVPEQADLCLSMSHQQTPLANVEQLTWHTAHYLRRGRGCDAQNGKPAPPMPQLPPLPPPSKEELAVMERQIRGLPPARKAALAWAMKARSLLAC